MTDQEKSILATPIGFSEICLKKKLYEWQRKILVKFCNRTPVRVAVSANNNAGKTTYIVAPLALWFACLHPNSLVIITASVERQISDVVFHELRKYAGLFPKNPPNKTDWELPNGSRIIGFCTNQAGKFESWHNKNFLLIADEAKSIAPEIFLAFDRCRPSHELLISSPGQKSGEFFKSFTNPNYGFETLKVTAFDCPHVTKEEIEHIERKYNHQQAFIRSTIYGEFMDDDGSYVIGTGDVHFLWDNLPLKLAGERTAFIDFGAGGDETAIAIMDGNEVLPVISWRDSNTMATVGRCMTILKEKSVMAKNVWYDEGGIGIPMGHALREAGWNCHPVNNGGTPYDERHTNRGSEMWWDSAYLIKNRKIRLPKEDDILIEQMTSRLAEYTSKGKIGVESKEDMAKRGLHSPDRADAVCGVLSNFRWGYWKVAKNGNHDPIQDKLDKQLTEHAAVPGADGGLY